MISAAPPQFVRSQVEKKEIAYSTSMLSVLLLGVATVLVSTVLEVVVSPPMHVYTKCRFLRKILVVT